MGASGLVGRAHRRTPEGVVQPSGNGHGARESIVIIIDAARSRFVSVKYRLEGWNPRCDYSASAEVFCSPQQRLNVVAKEPKAAIAVGAKESSNTIPA